MECLICARTSEDEKLFEFHHLEPVASRRKTKEKVRVCTQCADQIHLLFTNHELRSGLNTLEALKANERMQKYVDWVKEKPIESRFVVARKKKR